MKKIDTAVTTGTTEFFAGTLKPGLTYLTITEDGVGIPAENPNMSPEATKAVSEATNSLKAKTIKVPETKEDVQQYLNKITVNGKI